jgi:CO/xanthine dehydrogenase Mo-binding subunit
MSKFSVGRPLRRVEDAHLVTRSGRCVGDIDATRQLHSAVLRSPLAHAPIRSIDASAARVATTSQPRMHDE